MPSLPLEIAIYFNWFFFIAYLISGVLLFIYKSTTLFYPKESLVWDSMLLVCLALIDFIRISLISRGNRTGNLECLIKGAILGIVATVAYT